MAQVSKSDVVVGGYYYVRRDDAYKVSKVLAVSPGIVHLRSFRNAFSSPPTPDDIPSLRLGMTLDELMAFAKDPQKAGPIGIGHAPISREGFLNDDHVLFAMGPVEDSELEGYRDWGRAPERDEPDRDSSQSASWLRRLFGKGRSSGH